MKYLLAILLTGCAGSFEEARAPLVGAKEVSEHCRDLDAAHALWSSMGKGSAVVAGGTAMAPLVEEVRSDKVARISVAATAGVFAAFSAFSAHMAGLKGESWARECAE